MRRMVRGKNRSVESPFLEWKSERRSLPLFPLTEALQKLRLKSSIKSSQLALSSSLQSAPRDLPPLTAGKLRPVAALSL